MVMRFMLPTSTSSFDSSFSDDIPLRFNVRMVFPGKGRGTGKTIYVDKRPERKADIKPELTLRTLPTYLITKFVSDMKYGFLSEEDKQNLRAQRAVLP